MLHHYMYQKKGVFLSFLFLFMVFYAYAQETVSGRITSVKDHLPLPGVSVIVKGTTNGVISNDKGEYSLQAFGNATLVFSSVAFEKKEIPVNDRQKIDVVLQQSATGLNEVVVVGYGTQKKVNLTGAVDQIGGEELAKRPIANVFQGLQGASPGLNLTYYGGQPGQAPDINIRGYTSINGGSPLIVIDGIAAATDDLLRLNPADIASITVLRDAASAAIYGARAAYGVLLVTTKKGTSDGRQTVSYSNYFAWSKPTLLPEAVTDPYIFSRVLETSTDNTPWDYVNFSDEYYKWAKARSDDPSIEDVRLDPADPTQWAYMGNNNWNDYFFSKANFSQYHSISFSGSSSSDQKLPMKYLLSVNYTKENGLIKITKDDWKRYGLRGRINFSPLRWLKIDNNLAIYQLDRNAPTNSVTDIYYLKPTMVIKNPDGTWGNNAAGSLAAELVDGGRNLENRFGFQNTIRGVASFLNNDLQITGDASFKRELWKYHAESLPYLIGYGPDDVREKNSTGYIAETNGTIKQDVLDLFANYNKTIQNHTIKLVAGYSQESYEWSPVSVSKTNPISASVPYLGLTSGDATVTTTGHGGYYGYAIRSYFGRIHYMFKEKYIIEGNGRYDGSSRFPENNRWGFFPSISGAWIAGKENFMQGLKPVLSSLKFRASYGNLGNQSVNYYGYIQSLPTRLSSYLIDGSTRQTVLGEAPSLAVDPNNYTWEKVTTTNVGADIGFADNKLLASFDYYIRNTIGMLAPSRELPAVLGTSAPQQNAADLSTKGWELSLNYQNIFSVASKSLSFHARFILSNSKSVITRYDNELKTFSAAYREGEVIGEIWGLTNDGFFQNKDGISKLDETEIIPWGALSIVPGWPKYKDLDGNGKIELGPSVKDPKDLKIIGNRSPRYRFGFNLDMSWNGIDLSLFLQGIGKRDFYPQHYLFWGPYQQPYANVYPWNLDFYRAESDNEQERAMHSKSYIAAGLADANTDSYFPVLQSWLADDNYGTGLDFPQTKYLLNAAYLRVKNLTIGYTLPYSFTQRYGIRRLRIFFSGENLFEFSEIKKYLDPESITDGYGWEYPYQRKYSFGLNIDL